MIDPKRYRELAALERGWDTYDGLPPTDAALGAIGTMCVVPTSDGGLQLEWHANGWDVEINVGPDGTPIGFFSDRKRQT